MISSPERANTKYENGRTYRRPASRLRPGPDESDEEDSSESD
jgi:hypothetical protein